MPSESNGTYDSMIERDMSKVLAEATNVINKERNTMPRDYATEAGQGIEARPQSNDASIRIFGYGVESLENVRNDMKQAYTELEYWRARVSDLEHAERTLEQMINNINPEVPRPADTGTKASNRVY